MVISKEKLKFIELIRGDDNPQKLVFTNGCFDILSRTHVMYLQWCKMQGHILFVGVNSDQSVKELKGEGRPFNTLHDRLFLLNSLKCVDYVTHFDSLRCDDLIRKIRPDIYVKGGDYTLNKLDRDEYDALQECETEIRFAPNPDPVTTTDLVGKIRNLISANKI
jgi:rfaE bifunctional protein nucleotidyltransferase chain/domain